MHPDVDTFIANSPKWQDEYNTLRGVLLDCGLTEVIKWGVPCYMDRKKNIALIHGFKSYFALGFFKGSLMQDPEGVMEAQGENTQSSRTLKLKDVQHILELEPVIRAYIAEAIDLERSGAKLMYKKKSEYDIPVELQNRFDENPAFSKAFHALTEGRQKAYIIYFSGAKQSKTVEDRIDKFTERILNGKGFNDCTCGYSKKLPGCDGSHKEHGGKPY